MCMFQKSYNMKMLRLSSVGAAYGSTAPFLLGCWLGHASCHYVLISWVYFSGVGIIKPYNATALCRRRDWYNKWASLYDVLKLWDCVCWNQMSLPWMHYYLMWHSVLNLVARHLTDIFLWPYIHCFLLSFMGCVLLGIGLSGTYVVVVNWDTDCGHILQALQQRWLSDESRSTFALL
jgi:hypothetical protein